MSVQEMAGHSLSYCPELSAEKFSTIDAGPYSFTHHPHFIGSTLKPTCLTISPVQTGRHAAESQVSALFILKWASSKILPGDLEARGE